jgi:hypothetical protein
VSATILIWKLYVAKSRLKFIFLSDANAHFGNKNKLSKSLIQKLRRELNFAELQMAV